LRWRLCLQQCEHNTLFDFFSKLLKPLAYRWRRRRRQTAAVPETTYSCSCLCSGTVDLYSLYSKYAVAYVASVCGSLSVMVRILQIRRQTDYFNFLRAASDSQRLARDVPYLKLKFGSLLD